MTTEFGVLLLLGLLCLFSETYRVVGVFCAASVGLGLVFALVDWLWSALF